MIERIKKDHQEGKDPGEMIFKKVTREIVRFLLQNNVLLNYF